MAFHVGSLNKPTDVTSIHDPAPSSPRSPGPNVHSRSVINYPRQKPFLRYLEELVNPKIRNDQPTLVKREPPSYLTATPPTKNPFRYIRFERINELKEHAQARKDEEKERFSHANDISQKVPLWIRQRHTAAANLRKLIHEENVKEIAKYGRLFEPNSLTAQPVGSTLSKLAHPTNRAISHSYSVTVRSPIDEATLNDAKQGHSIDETRSVDLESETKDQISRADHELVSAKLSNGRDFNQTKELPTSSKKVKRYEGLHQFVQDRRRVCLLELAIRTKRGEVNRLDTIMQAENEFLTHEEQELLRKHEEHDRYLKSICQRTAEAIRLAEGEARKRNEITDKIKRARYRLAHLNAECVKLEEEYLRLSTYKEFLHKVAETFREHHTHLKAVSKQNRDSVGTSHKLSTTHSVITNLSEAATRDSTSDVELDVAQLDQNSERDESEDDSSLIDFFTSPQDLVDILSELESNNLTLIENVQEQEEVCERVRAKAAKLYSLLNVERKTVDDHIARERKNITGIHENVNSISLARNALSDFVLLERYAKVFYLGDMNQFEILEPSALITPVATPSTSKSPTTTTGNRAVVSKANTPLVDPSELRPTISTLLSLLQVQIQKVYSAVYGTNEGGARLDTLVMLRRLETTVDELSEMLNAYPRNLVLKAKRTVDERNRVNARRRQKVDSQVAYERRLERAIKKAREPPRWRYGRRVLTRSRPPEVKRVVHKGAVSEESEEENRSLFQ